MTQIKLGSKKNTLKNRALKGINNITKKLENNKVKRLSEYAKKKVKEAQKAKEAAEKASIDQGVNPKKFYETSALQLKQKARKLDKIARAAEVSSLTAVYDVANKVAEKEEKKLKDLSGNALSEGEKKVTGLKEKAEKAKEALDKATTTNKEIDAADDKLTDTETKLNEYEIRIDRAIQEAKKVRDAKDKIIDQAEKAKDAAKTATNKGTKKNMFGKSYINSAKTLQDKIGPAEESAIKALDAVLAISVEVKKYYDDNKLDEIKDEIKGQFEKINKKFEEIGEQLKNEKDKQKTRAEIQTQKEAEQKREKNAATTELTRATETLKTKTTELDIAKNKVDKAKEEFDIKSKERIGKLTGDPSIEAKVTAESAYNKAKRELKKAEDAVKQAKEEFDKATLVVELYVLKGGKYINRNININRKTRKLRKI